MHKKYYLQFILFFVLSNLSIPLAFSQISNADEQNYFINVKQFNEFIDRFNYKTDFRGEKIDQIHNHTPVHRCL